MSDNEVGQFDYESELDDEVDTIQFGKYKGLTPLQVLMRDPGYIVWATNSFPTGWVGSQVIISSALQRVPNATKQYPAFNSHKFTTPDQVVKAFEACMLETFGEFPTPYWKTKS